MESLDLTPQVRPGSILNARPLPRPPHTKPGLLEVLGKFLGSRETVTHLHTELLQVVQSLQNQQPEQARRRLARITTNLREIRRDGTQFVLSPPEWQALIAIGAEMLPAAERIEARPEILAAIRIVLEKLEEFGAGEFERYL